MGRSSKPPRELAAYEHQLDEARRRDHRRIGRDLKLFDLFDEVGPGHVVWLPAGATVRRELERWIEDLEPSTATSMSSRQLSPSASCMCALGTGHTIRMPCTR